jgi:hypothetical protein
VYEGTDLQALLELLLYELRYLTSALPTETETTLIVLTGMYADFEEYNDFLYVADAAVEELMLEGILQVASFHPDYQFADIEPDDVANYTNRSPYPMLHLLREDSITRAIETYPDTDSIPDNNIETLRRLGIEALRNLMK